ncbi:N-acetylmuramoyl-L-alanine amidase [Hymenobacter rubripertinctus]|uniref:N-acetylmuramoyl-L-alanine amidase n=1 Tax=Hymenobacter rubripertinctus TaxID=2029981 RepID=A0A418QML3_9BACT|nr:N-acetylmuramoyl-L-alanine amidase [Hymenobacter rubripertinctus]RIY06466.1 N-acetylmuramoyl-L-alanine amidase [Hymenobacter rubripertinctus]
MRTITHIVLHCTATPQSATVAGILNYWRTQLGWKNPGYHILIEPNGTCHRLLADEVPSNGVKGHNAHSLHVSYIGGVDGRGRPLDTRTPHQLAEMERIVRRWKAEHPNAQVVGHRDFPGVTKACPSFDARTWWVSIH